MKKILSVLLSMAIIAGAVSVSFSASAASSPFISGSYTHTSKISYNEILNGIDVSEFNGSNIDWKKAKAAGVEFAFVRVGYRGYGTAGNLVEDSCYKKNITGAISAGVSVGVYIYSQATTQAEAKQEADFLTSRIKGYNIELPIVLDFEFAESGSGFVGRLYNAFKAGTATTKKNATALMNAFCTQARASGYTPLVYANANMLTTYVNKDDISAEIWLANYTKKTTYTGEFRFWQYTDSGYVNGIGKVDCNFWYKKTAYDIDFKVSKRGSNALTLSWKKDDKAVSYEISRYQTALSGYGVIATPGKADTSYIDTSLASANVYSYRIRAVYEDGSHSDENLLKTITVPTKPEITSWSSDGAKITVNWKAVTRATGYAIYRYNDSTGNYDKIGTAKTLSFSDTTVSANKTYKYKVRAYVTFNSGNYYSEYSAEMSAKSAPKKVTAVVATGTNTSQIKLTWTKVSGAQGYRVYRYDASKKQYVRIKILEKGETTYVNTVAKAKKYKYKIKAYSVYNGKYLLGESCIVVNASAKSKGKVTASALNVRTGAGTSYSKKTSLAKGTKVTVLGTTNYNWLKISYTKSGKAYTGYVDYRYISLYK